MKDVIEFIHDNGQFIVENAYIFVIWTLICVSATSAIMAKRNDRSNQKLVEENQRLQKENEYLHSMFDGADSESRLLAGKNLGDAVSAKDVSDGFRKG